MKTIETILGALVVAFAVYMFFLLISNIDFSGMSFSDAKFIVSVCVGVAVSIVSVTKGVHVLVSALCGFVTAAILHVLILFVIEHI